MPNDISTYKTYNVGYCKSFACISAKNTLWKTARFHTRVFLLDVPSIGLILIDTGYGSHFFTATKKLPYFLYRTLAPVTLNLQDNLICQLKQDNIHPQDIAYIVLTHYHPAQIGSLKDFPNTKLIYTKFALDALTKLRPFQAFKQGFIHSLMPAIPPNSMPLTHFPIFPFSPYFPACDLFYSGSIYFFLLPGHALGQIGVALKTDSGWTLFVADAAWSQKELGTNTPPNSFGCRIQHHSQTYLNTFYQLHLLQKRPYMTCIPSHNVEI